jgi:hypothetical protein
MNQPDHLSPLDKFLRAIYVSMLGMAAPTGEFAAWCITGVAAILALVISQLASISKIVDEASLRWGIVLLTCSMLIGASVKQIGIALQKGLEMLDKLYAEFSTADGKATIQAINIPPDEIQKKMVEPFLWPLRAMMWRSAQKGAVDYIAGEKLYLKLLSFQIILAFAQSLTAAFGLLWMAFGIK